MPLRDYQHELASQGLEALNNGDKKVILQSPTGSGKNYMMGYICKQANRRGGSSIFTVAGRNVVSQFTNSLDEFNVPWTYVMSGEKFDSYKKFYVSSIDTLQSWFFKPNSKFNRSDVMIPDYLLVDEMRLCCTGKRGEVIDYFADAGSKVIGFDATPIHPRMHLVWDNLIQGKPTPWHIERGNLAPVTHYSPSSNDENFIEQLQQMKSKGDYKEKDLEDLMDKRVLIGDIISNYENISMNEYGDFKPFVVACVNKKHARGVEDAFLEANHKVEYIDADTPTEERMEMFARIKSGETLGIVSVLTMTYGVDIPNLHICINARPSKSLALFLQLGGRVLRTCEGKSHAVLIDHAGAIREHGYLDDVYRFSLDPDQPVTNETKEERASSDESAEVDITCSNCTHVYKNSPNCPKCGHENVVGFDEHNVVYLNTDLVVAHREEVAQHEKSLEDWKWLSAMKSIVWNNPKLKNDSARVNALNDICNIKFKQHFNPQDIMSLQAGSINDEVKRYYRYYNIRKSKRYSKR